MEEWTGNISAEVTGCVLDVHPACETPKVPRAPSQTLQTSVSRLKVKICDGAAGNRLNKQDSSL